MVGQDSVELKSYQTQSEVEKTLSFRNTLIIGYYHLSQQMVHS